MRTGVPAGRVSSEEENERDNDHRYQPTIPSAARMRRRTEYVRRRPARERQREVFNYTLRGRFSATLLRDDAGC